MLFGQLYAQGTILRTALQGTLARNQVIVNNIANVDVPGFKRSWVDFEDALFEALGDYPRNRNINLDGVTHTARVDRADLHTRIDGNNVDIEVEMVLLYQNSMKFDTLVSSVMANSRRLSMVLQGGR